MKFLFSLFSVILISSLSYAQVGQIGAYNNATQDYSDPSIPWYGDAGVRTVWYAGDMDNDGKDEIVATDYTNGGRVHLLEYDGANTLEIVWSSPVQGLGAGSSSTPRWVRTGDMDGDGNMEIIFPSQTSESIQFFEWDGTDNGFGDAPAFQIYSDILPNDEGLKFNREQATVYDFDGDGKDELITSGLVSRKYIYVIGISGFFPGFASAAIEGGAGTQNAADFGSTGSMWHSVPGDFDGDGKIEIVNHHWDNLAYWGIEINGPDSYAYPDLSEGTADQIYKKVLPDDGVNYMGVQVLDVDGDGKDEFAGIIYGGNADGSDSYDAWLNVLPAGTDIRYAFGDLQSAKIAERDDISALAGGINVSFWGIGAADLNGNGRDELILGGGRGANLVSVEYNGSGDILDINNYTNTILFANGPEQMWGTITYTDSAGVLDTTYTESPFVSKMYAGTDMNGNGKKEIIAAYQSVYDTTTVIHKVWNGTEYVKDTTRVGADNIINIRMFEYGTTGIEVKDLNIVTPDEYKLEQNYPNPFNPTTTIRFSIPMNKQISLKVYDLLGREVKTLIDNSEMAKGSYEVTWDGTNNAGVEVASGNYIYTLRYGNFSKSLKMNLVR